MLGPRARRVRVYVRGYARGCNLKSGSLRARGHAARDLKFKCSEGNERGVIHGAPRGTHETNETRRDETSRV